MKKKKGGSLLKWKRGVRRWLVAGNRKKALVAANIICCWNEKEKVIAQNGDALLQGKRLREHLDVECRLLDAEGK